MVVVTKRNVLKSQLPLIIVAATVVLLTLVWLVYRTLVHSKCDSVFEQTADRVRADVEFIKIKGKLALGQEKVQELAEASQKLGLHVKSCCIAQQARILNADQFQVCMSGAKDYQNQIIQVANNIKEANAARKNSKSQSLQGKKLTRRKKLPVKSRTPRRFRPRQPRPPPASMLACGIVLFGSCSAPPFTQVGVCEPFQIPSCDSDLSWRLTERRGNDKERQQSGQGAIHKAIVLVGRPFTEKIFRFATVDTL